MKLMAYLYIPYFGHYTEIVFNLLWTVIVVACIYQVYFNQIYH